MHVIQFMRRSAMAALWGGRRMSGSAGEYKGGRTGDLVEVCNFTLLLVRHSYSRGCLALLSAAGLRDIVRLGRYARSVLGQETEGVRVYHILLILAGVLGVFEGEERR